MYLTLHCNSQESRNAAESYIVNHICSVDVYKLGGKFEYGIHLFIGHHAQISLFLEGLSDIPDLQIANKTIILRSATSIMRRNYMVPYDSLRQSFYFSSNEFPVTLSSLERRIVNGLFSAPNPSPKELSDFLQIPPGSVHYGLKRLFDSGVWLGNAYGIYVQKLGFLQFRLLVELRSNGAEFKKILSDLASNNPNIISSVQVIGPWDYELLYECRHQDETSLVRDQLSRVLRDKLGSVTILPLLNYLKVAPRDISSITDLKA